MRIGLIARAENRGLGHITWEVHRHLAPTATLAVSMGELARGFVTHMDRYPDATWVRFDEHGRLPNHAVSWARDNQLDVVYSAETFYDWRIVADCTAAGIGTVLHTMPEFHRRPECDTPSTVWLPTPWRELHHLNARLVPVPVATDRPWARAADPMDMGPLRVLHVAGHAAAGDRNGTQLFLEALAGIRARVHVTVITQDRGLPGVHDVGPGVTLERVLGGVDDYWEMYGGQHVMVMPRRYGGLCLPVQEAMAAGLAVVMPRVSPNTWWPTRLVPAGRGSDREAPAGPIHTANVDVRALAETITTMAKDRQVVADYQAKSREWAQAHSWEALAPTWLAALGDARVG